MKKSAMLGIPKRSSKMPKTYLSDSDSDSLPPGVMLPRHRVPQTDSSAKSTPKSKPKSKTTPSPKVVKHLGSFEITSSSESDARAPPRKRPKKPAKAASHSVEVIDLCSDKDTPASKSSPKKGILDENVEVVVIESSDDDGPVVDVHDSELIDSSSVHDTPNAMARRDPEETSHMFSGDSATRSSERTLDDLQRSYRELMMNSRPSRRARSQRTSIFSSFSYSIHPRAIRLMEKGEAVTSTILHTPVYFRRAEDSIRARMKAKRKKPKALSSGSPVISTALKPVAHPARTQTTTVPKFQPLVSSTDRATNNIINDAINDLPLNSTTQTPPDIAKDMIVAGNHAPEQSLPPSLIQAPKDSHASDQPHTTEDMLIDFPMVSPNRSPDVVEEKMTTDTHPTNTPLAAMTSSDHQYADKILISKGPSMIVDERIHLAESRSREIGTDDSGVINTAETESSARGTSLLDASEPNRTPMSAHTTTTAITISTTTFASTITTPRSAELSTLMQNLNYEDDDDFNLSDFELLYPDSE